MRVVRSARPPAALAFAAAVGCLVASPLVAETPVPASTAAAQPGPVFRSGIDLLSLDVTVVDAQGRPPGDLAAGDFVVTVDGQPRKVVSADLVRLADPLATLAPAPVPPPADAGIAVATNAGLPRGRLVVIVVDQGNIRAGNARPIMFAAAKFIDRLTPADRVGLVAIPQPGPAIDFTADHARIREAMMRIVGTASGPQRQRFNLGFAEARAIHDHSDLILAQQVFNRECLLAGAGNAQERDRCERDIEVEAGEMVVDRMRQTASSIRALQDVLRGLQGSDAPKSVLVISEGLILEGLGGELQGVADLAAAAHVSMNVIVLDVARFEASQMAFPTTAGRDRELELAGLETLAGIARGSLFRVVGTPDPIFARIERETSAYYVLGIEPLPADRDGQAHKVNVDVRRKGLTVRAQRTFASITALTKAASAEQRVAEVLGSPILETEVLLRVATYVSRSANAGKVRVQVVAEVESAPSEATDYVVALRVTAPDGRLAAGAVERRTLQPAIGAPAGVREFAGALDVEPGTYAIKLAVMDASGRRGSVELPVTAWHFGGETLAPADLVVADAPAAGGGLRAAVEPRIQSRHVAGLFDVYAANAATFDRAKVWIEVADRQDGPALVTMPARLIATDAQTTRSAQAVLDVGPLPPGRYVARARIEIDGRPAGLVARPLVVLPRAAAAAANGSGAAPAEETSPAGPARVRVTPPPFDRRAVLAPEVLAALLSAAETRAGAGAQKAMAEARAGRFGPAALAAFEAGDQTLAAFLKGVDLYAKGQLDAAAVQLQTTVKAGPHPPAMYLLAACFASVGRDAEAASYWQIASNAGSDLPGVYRLLGEVRLRRGETTLAVAPLRSAVARAPADAVSLRWLALAEAAVDPVEALPHLAQYLDLHAGDTDVLLAAMQAIVELHTSGRAPAAPLATKERFARWAASYPRDGADRALVDRWVAYMSR